MRFADDRPAIALNGERSERLIVNFTPCNRRSNRPRTDAKTGCSLA